MASPMKTGKATCNFFLVCLSQAHCNQNWVHPMYFFAHVFSGALFGLGLMYLIHDRRVVPVCILGSVFPDLLDKPLALIFPGILGTSRTIGHSLIFFCIMVVAGVLLWHYRRTLLGLVFSCGVLSHQLLDAIWNLPGTWFFPLMG